MSVKLNFSVQNMPMSKATKYFGRATPDAINFSIGEPLFSPPDCAKSAYVKAINEGYNKYAPIQGFSDLREKISEKLKSENGIEASPEEIIVTNGATEAIGYSILSLVDKGDEVITCEPDYPIVDPMVSYCGGRSVPLALKEENSFQIDLEELKNAVTQKTKLVVINTPHNPTGAVFPKNTLKAISEICDCAIISDEVYEKIIYEGSHTSIASVTDKPENVITINSFSKSYCMCGYRVGYLHAQRSLIERMLHLKLYLSNCVNAPTQKAACAALDDKEFPKKLRSEFLERRDALMGGFKKIGIECVSPKGAFYAFPNISGWGTDTEVYEMLLKAGVVTMPGRIFSEFHKEHVRFSFVCGKDDINKGIGRMESCLK